jgi:hypothetical protein
MKLNPYYIVLSFFLILLTLYSFEKLMYLDSNIACAKFIYQSESRGVKYVHYTVNINEEVHDGSLSMAQLKIKSMDKLKKIDCLKVEYSNYSSFFNRVVDKRVLK